MIQNWKENNFFLGEDDFREQIKKIEKEWISTLEEGYVDTAEGIKIHYYIGINPDAKANVVISHGFCESFPKYYEVAWNIYRAGYSVFFCEHRGHGFSSREDLDDVSKVYVKDYDLYVEDFYTFINKKVIPAKNDLKLILFAHSMGGCIGTLFLEKYPDIFDAAVLSSPMIKMQFKGYPEWVTKLVMTVTNVLPWDKKFVPGQGSFNPGDWFERSSMKSKERFWFIQDKRAAHDEYKTFGGTYAWTRASIKATKSAVKNLSKINIPVLMLEAGMDSLVDNEGHRLFEEAVKTTETVIFPEAKHEIFNSTEDDREGFYISIFSWLEKQNLE